MSVVGVVLGCIVEVFMQTANIHGAPTCQVSTIGGLGTGIYAVSETSSYPYDIILASLGEKMNKFRTVGVMGFPGGSVVKNLPANA